MLYYIWLFIDIKTKALELLKSICEFDDDIFKQIPNLMEGVVKVLIYIMLQIPDDPNWENCVNPEDEDGIYDDSLCPAAESNLYSMCHTSK